MKKVAHFHLGYTVVQYFQQTLAVYPLQFL